MTQNSKSAPRADLSHIETWIFDLDNTLYPAQCNLFAQIDERMGAFISELFAVDRAEARRIQKSYLHSHGTTLTGLMEIHGVEPQGFLEFVHDIDISVLMPDAQLAHAITRLPGRRIVYTNGSAKHAQRVLDRLGLSHAFEAIHDIAAAGYCPKPREQAYTQFISRFGLNAGRTAMLEDMACNLEVPHAMGMTTVLVSADKPWHRPEDPPERNEPAEHIHFVAENLAHFLATAHLMPYQPAAPPPIRASR